MSSPSEVRHFFDQAAGVRPRTYVQQRWLSSPIRRAHYAQTWDAIVELAPREYERALEVGSGPLVWTQLLTRPDGHLIAVDISHAMLYQGIHECGIAEVSCCCGDMGQLPVAAASVDGIYSIRSLEYVSSPQQAVREFARVMRRNGFLFIITKNPLYRGYLSSPGSTFHCTSPIHGGELGLNSLLSLLDSCGFRSVRYAPVVLGRGNNRHLWTAFRRLSRLLRHHVTRSLWLGLLDHVESYAVLARPATDAARSR